jgi:hypothetical protein
MTGVSQLEKVYDRLFAWCEERSFAGPDPFDGLNSQIFQATPLKTSRLARLAWLQMVKRSGIGLRSALRVTEGINPKTLSLFALAEISRFRASGEEIHLAKAAELVDLLLGLRIAGRTQDGGTTTAFGYNFDWQSRVLYAPKGTPAIVPTAFACKAMVELFEANSDPKYLTAADEVCRFILNYLNRPVESDDELCFSYTPLDNTQVYNASLLAGETLATVGSLTLNGSYLESAAKSARFVIRRQRQDGAWSYGSKDKQQWVDNFHTAYVLVSLRRIVGRVQEVAAEADPSIGLGMQYWMDNLFLADGTPKYYDKETYPIDIHSAAAAIAGLAELGENDHAIRVAGWTLRHMLDGEGFFYYQVRKGGAVKIPYMRWGQAWMAYAIARLIEMTK